MIIKVKSIPVPHIESVVQISQSGLRFVGRSHRLG